jgi:hypothetical protein
MSHSVCAPRPWQQPCLAEKLPLLRRYDAGGRLWLQPHQGEWAKVVPQGLRPPPRSGPITRRTKTSCTQERLAIREAEREAALKALEPIRRKRVAEAKKLHTAQVRRQKKLLGELGVPDLSPEEATDPGLVSPGRNPQTECP